MKIGFLFNHYLSYQVQHGAPYAFQLSRIRPDYEVEILCSTDEAVEEAKKIERLYPGSNCSIRNLGNSVVTKVISSVIRTVKIGIRTVKIAARSLTRGGKRASSSDADYAGRVSAVRSIFESPGKKSNAPNYRYFRRAMLLANLPRLSSFDALVAPEKFFLYLKSFPGFRDVKFIGVRHGAGDRPMPPLNKGKAKFDGLLVPGRAYFDRYKDQIPDGCCEIVGYPKFEIIEQTRPEVPRLFSNDLPTVLYTPHFNPEQSSWIGAGRDVLSFFAERDDLNLIFAPHIRLFQRLEYSGGVSLNEFRDRPNILIDTGSESSIDMTYTRAADIYLGDVSSQVYEFVFHRRRPCVFLNLHSFDASEMQFWRFGPVIDGVADLADALLLAEQNFLEVYQGQQDDLVEAAFSASDTPPSQRGAEAIVRILGIHQTASEPLDRGAHTAA